MRCHESITTRFHPAGLRVLALLAMPSIFLEPTTVVMVFTVLAVLVGAWSRKRAASDSNRHRVTT
jgi:hypothetical protein